MPLVPDHAQGGPRGEVDAAAGVTVGLINNMPDSALEATERQFADLVRAGAQGIAVRLLLYSIPEVPRGEATRRGMAGRYRDVSELWDANLDGLIVTGTEPKTRNLKDEPYWQTLTRVIGWARDHTASTIWSCLAAHAAVLHTDGIERRPFREKLSGVFDCASAGAHPITRALSLPLRIPHSRNNDLSETALKAAGYQILTRSEEAGVDMFARQERSFHLFLQGHPEYEPGSLLREYRRDVGRYLRGEREHYPAMPRGYFDPGAAALLDAFRARALAERRGDLIASFPTQALEDALVGGWRSSAVAIYAKWFEFLKGRKQERRPPLAPVRRIWRDWPVRRVGAAADTRAIG